MRKLRPRHTYAHGGDNASSVLNWDKVDSIREMLKSRVPVKSIAEKFEVTPACIYKIARGKTWKRDGAEVGPLAIYEERKAEAARVRTLEERIADLEQIVELLVDRLERLEART